MLYGKGTLQCAFLFYLYFCPETKVPKVLPLNEGVAHSETQSIKLSDFCLLNCILPLLRSRKNQHFFLNKFFCRLIPLTLPLAVGGFSLHLALCEKVR